MQFRSFRHETQQYGKQSNNVVDFRTLASRPETLAARFPICKLVGMALQTNTDTAVIHPWIAKTVTILMDRDEITADETAERIGVSGQVLRSRMRGDSQWSVIDLVALGYLFRVSVDQLLNGLDGFVPPPRDFLIARDMEAQGLARAQKKARRSRTGNGGPNVAGAGFEPATSGLWVSAGLDELERLANTGSPATVAP